MAENAPLFDKNVNFLKFLNLVKNDPVFRTNLIEGNYAGIDSFPGLSNEEKSYLKGLDWKKMELMVDVNDTSAFKLTFASSEVCERKVASEVVERKCYK
jgi:hypothetical protein